MIENDDAFGKKKKDLWVNESEEDDGVGTRQKQHAITEQKDTYVQITISVLNYTYTRKNTTMDGGTQLVVTLLKAKLALSSIGSSPFGSNGNSVKGEDTDNLITNVQNSWLYIVAAAGVISGGKAAIETHTHTHTHTHTEKNSLLVIRNGTFQKL